jgi:small subunit ribosomal protein S9
MADKKKLTYIEATGRRKSSTARVRIFSNKKGNFIVNDKDLADYFSSDHQRGTAKEAIETAGLEKISVSARVSGGGLSSQAAAVRHGLARAIVKSDKDTRSPLKKAGFLKRDPRSKERRKFGLKKARKASQWSKR